MTVHQRSQQPAVLQNSVVVFSKNYLPVSRINIKRAIALLVTGQAESVDFSNTTSWQIRSPSVVLQVPEHIRLTVSNPERLWKVAPVNRREVFRRDNHTCQYCGTTQSLTIDHVIPKSKGVPTVGTTWWQLARRAIPTKAIVPPLEASMTLKNRPKAPIHPAVAFAEQFWKQQQDSEE